MKTQRFTIINGTPEEPQQRHMCAIRVFRVEQDIPEFIRLLTDDYGGCFTHYLKGRSSYCSGDNCRIPTHHTDRTWKGYAPALRLLRGPKPIWAPVCLEITENLELDLRDVFARGQLWELYRDEPGNKKSPIVGRLHRDPPPAELPKGFDIMPALRALYHRDVIDLRHLSPIPARVFVAEMEGDLPEALQPKPANERFTPPDGYSAAAEFNKKAQKAAAEQKPGRTAR